MPSFKPDDVLASIEKKALVSAIETAIRQRAREAYASDDLNIDDDAKVLPVDGGCWVQAWVFVHDGEDDHAA